MPTKISSYLTELGFKQIAYLGDTLNYNKTTAGEFIVVKENNRLYRYEENSTQPVDNMNVLNTSDGGNTRWITVGGAATTQTRVSYTFEEKSNTIPLGMTILSKDNILYVNIGNTQILSSEYSLNDDRNAIILPQEFDAGVQAEIVIIIGDFTPEQTGLPDQTGHAGEFLTTDGTNPSWADITIPENVVSADNYTNAKTWKGTLAEYEALTTYDDNITYLITDDYTGGSGGTSNYNDLENKPSINGIVLEGNKTTEDLLIEAGGTSNYNDLENKPSINGIALEGNKTTEDLLIEAGVSDYTNLINKPSINSVELIDNVDSKTLNIVPLAIDEYEEINATAIILNPHTKVYHCYTTNSPLNFTVNYTNMPPNFKYYTFELELEVQIGLAGEVTFNFGTFPIIWEIDTPTIDSTGIYNLVFKTYDGGEHWIGNLAYFIPAPTNESTFTINFTGTAGTSLNSITNLSFNNLNFSYRIKNQIIPETGTFSVSFKGITGNSYSYTINSTSDTITLNENSSVEFPVS